MMTSGVLAFPALAAGAAAALGLSAGAQPASAAYGQSANVFKKSRENLEGDYALYTADDYSILIPQRGFNPSPNEYLAEWPGVDVRWEDYGTTDFANVTVTVLNGEKLPKPSDLQFMLGESTWDGYGEFSTVNFTDPTSADLFAVNVLDSEEKTIDGKKYAVYELLTRTVDGSQGGRHHFISASTQGGKTYIAHWGHNQDIARAVRDSFRVG
eukprot:PRCOL_00002970-RA